MQCLGKFKVKISPNENVYINKILIIMVKKTSYCNCDSEDW